MNRISLKKLSVLGIVLTSASAITAAIVPKSENKVFNGQIQQSTGACNLTCLIILTGNPNCTHTANSGTTEGAGTSVLNNGSSVVVNSSKSPC